MLPVTFCLWIGLIVAELASYAFNDRLALWICKRGDGTWKPEYRLHCLWIPGLILLPVGLGIFGAALEYHLHYMVLAFGAFLVTVAAMALVPTTTNYVCECFVNRTTEAACIMGFYRLIFGLTVPFFIDAWIAAVGVGWVFGIAAFLSIGLFPCIMLLMWKGHEIRQYTFSGLNSNEEGQRLVGSTPVVGEKV